MMLRLVGLLLVLAGMGLAQERGVLKGSVRYPDGSPCGGATVVVQAGTGASTFISGEDGAFGGLFPAGEVVVSAAGARQTARIAAGEIATVTLTVKMTGVLVTLQYPETTPARATLLGAYKSPAGARESLSARPLPDGRYWFPEVPANSTAFSLIATRPEDHGQYGQRWTFDAPQELRNLTMTIGTGVPVSVTVVDGTGAPIANTAVRARLSYTVWDLLYWEDRRGGGGGYSREVTGVKTDAQGRVNLGRWPPSSATLLLSAGNKSGKKAEFEIKPDGTVTLDRYIADLAVRTVTQTVFSAAGKPAPGAAVTACYHWQGQTTYTRAIADAAGKVSWENLPPVRVIVWGAQVPAGVIPPDATTVTAPLPAPQPGGGGNKYLQLVGAGPPPYTAIWRITASVPEEERFGQGHFGDFVETRLSSDRPLFCASGQRISVGVLTRTNPPRLGALQDVYVPYANFEDTIRLPIELHDAVELRGRLVIEGGQTIPGVSRLGVVAEQSDPLPPVLAGLLDPATSKVAPVEQPDGAFSLVLPAPGTYRLLVDAFDRDVPAPPALRLTVTAGVNEKIIRLPAPLVTVPAGTELSWATLVRPLETKALRVAAHAPEMPVFGPQEHLLALWGRVRPNSLLVYTPRDKEPLRTLALRTVYLTATGKDGKPLTMRGINLFPLLPQPREVYWNNRPLDRDHPEAGTLTVLPGEATRAEIWSGRYVICSGWSYYETTVEIPAAGAPEITIPATGATFREFRRERAVRTALFPDADYDVLFKTTRSGPSITPDIPYFVQYPIDPGKAKGTGLGVPWGAKTLNVEWLGHGVMRNVPIPPGGTITLPTWEPGIVLAGTVLTPAGTPLANATVRLKTDYSWVEMEQRVQTDGQGRFTSKGIMPGSVLMIMLGGDQQSGWTVRMPENGPVTLTLKMQEKPIAFSQGYHGDNDRFEILWWVPDGGKPLRVPMVYPGFAADELPLGPGWLWATNRDGRSKGVRLTLERKIYALQELVSTAPPLGLCLPFTPEKGFPQEVVLTGTGPLAGLRAAYDSLTWSPSAQLGVMLFQFNALPPGPYQVLINTPQGRVEEQVTVTAEGGAVVR